MEQILRQLVEDGEKVAIVKFTNEGDIKFMGNQDLVNILETQKQTIEFKANIAGAKGMGNVFVKDPAEQEGEEDQEDQEEQHRGTTQRSTSSRHQATILSELLLPRLMLRARQLPSPTDPNARSGRPLVPA
jgi:hypothetical protein